MRADLEGIEPYGAPQLAVPVRLNTNETPWPPPAAFSDQLAKRVADLELHRYPDREALELRRVLAARTGLAPERVWVANGSNEVLVQLFQAYGGAGRSLLLARPGYSAHPLLARVAATDVVEVDLDEELRLTPEAAADAVRRLRPELVCLASPNNPTGIPVPAEAVRAAHDAGSGLVIVDEAYVEFGDATVAGLLDDLHRLVVVRTFSKAFRLAGIRLGYLLAHDWVVDDLPCWIRTKHGPMVAVPYTLDLNDSVIYAVEKHSSDEQYRRLMSTLEAVEPELEQGPRVITLSLHHHLNGVLHRIGYVEKMLDALLARRDTVFMTGGQIADWFMEAESRASPREPQENA